MNRIFGPCGKFLAASLVSIFMVAVGGCGDANGSGDNPPNHAPGGSPQASEVMEAGVPQEVLNGAAARFQSSMNRDVLAILKTDQVSIVIRPASQQAFIHLDGAGFSRQMAAKLKVGLDPNIHLLEAMHADASTDDAVYFLDLLVNRFTPEDNPTVTGTVYVVSAIMVNARDNMVWHNEYRSDLGAKP